MIVSWYREKLRSGTLVVYGDDSVTRDRSGGFVLGAGGAGGQRRFRCRLHARDYILEQKWGGGGSAGRDDVQDQKSLVMYSNGNWTPHN